MVPEVVSQAAPGRILRQRQTAKTKAKIRLYFMAHPSVHNGDGEHHRGSGGVLLGIGQCHLGLVA